MHDIGAEAQVFFGSSGPPLDPHSVVQATGNFLKINTAGRTSHANRLQGLMDESSVGYNPALDFVNRYSELFREFEKIFSLDREAIVPRAIFNQKLAQSLWRAQEDYAIAGGADEFITIIRAMDNEDIPLGTECNKIVSGARAQAGLMHVFETAGYEVVVPDSANQNEVKKWDVEAGVDLVAFDEENQVLYLIDAKSDSYERDEYEYRGYHYAFDEETNGRNAQKYHNVTKDALNKIKQSTKGVRFCHVTITLDNNAMDNFGKIDSHLGEQLVSSLNSTLLGDN